MMNFKKIKRRVNYRNNFIDLIAEFVDQEISPEFRRGYDTSTLTNFLTALIHPKESPRGARPEEATKSSKPKSSGCSSGYSSSSDTNFERQKIIEKLSEET